jgi:predicted phage terminase large subunit-like protein
MRLVDALERVARGELRRLAIVMPPRHAKTETAVRLFVPWFLGRFPDKRVICATYGQDLADDHGRDVRRIITSETYGRVFPLELAGDSKARDSFDIAGRDGGARFVGRDGSLTGRGAHLVLLDDLLKNREEADSRAVRESSWSLFADVLRTRLEPGGAIIAIGTRWHFDDWLGRMLALEHEHLELLHFPAIDENGAALWPSRFDVGELEAIRSTLGTRSWSALYQGKPVPDTGDYFKAEWFRTYDERPAELNVYCAVDLAYSERETADWTAIGIFGIDRQRRIFLLDWWRGRGTLSATCAVLVELVRTYKPQVIVHEADPGTRAVLSIVKEKLIVAGSYRKLYDVSAAGDKSAKARAVQAMFELGRVFFPRGVHWRHDLEAELLAFPASPNDDQVDVLSLIGRVIDQFATAPAPPPKKQDEIQLMFKVSGSAIYTNMTLDEMFEDYESSHRRNF